MQARGFFTDRDFLLEIDRLFLDVKLKNFMELLMLIMQNLFFWNNI